MNVKGLLSTVLRVGLAVGLIGILVWINRIELARLGERQWNWPILAAALLLTTASIAITFVRWYVLVRAVGLELSLSDAFRLGFLGDFCKYLGPGAVGGDLIKAVWLMRGSESRRLTAVGTVFLDRVLGLVALFIVGAATSLLPAGVPATREVRLMTTGLWVGAIAGVVVLGIAMQPALTRLSFIRRLGHLRWIGRPIQELLDSAALYQQQPGQVAIAVALSLVGHFGMLSAFYLCSVGVNGGREIPSYLAHLMFVPAAEVFAVLIPTPGGTGALEGALQEFYALVAGPEASKEALAAARSNGFLMGIMYRAITLIVAMIGLVFYLTTVTRVAPAAATATAARAPDKSAVPANESSMSTSPNSVEPPPLTPVASSPQEPPR